MTEESSSTTWSGRGVCATSSWLLVATDVIHVHVEGRRNGKPAVDYSINAEVGVPLMTGPAEAAVPVNHVLPAWDLVTGMLTASAVTSALFRRERTGEGARVDVALADVALAGVAGMGWLAEADELRHPRPRVGNHMFGSFGVDFATADGRRIMVVALTEGQWTALRRVTGTDHVFSALEETLDADLDREGDRYRLRETIASVLRPWFEARDFATLEKLLDDAKVLWSPYRDMAEVAADARSSARHDRRRDRPARHRPHAGGRRSVAVERGSTHRRVRHPCCPPTPTRSSATCWA